MCRVQSAAPKLDAYSLRVACAGPAVQTKEEGASFQREHCVEPGLVHPRISSMHEKMERTWRWVGEWAVNG